MEFFALPWVKAFFSGISVEAAQLCMELLLSLFRTLYLFLVRRLFFPRERGELTLFLLLSAESVLHTMIELPVRGLYLPCTLAVLLCAEAVNRRRRFAQTLFVVPLFMNLFCMSSFFSEGLRQFFADGVLALLLRRMPEGSFVEYGVNLYVILLLLLQTFFLSVVPLLALLPLRAALHGFPDPPQSDFAALSYAECAFLSILNITGILLFFIFGDLYVLQGKEEVFLLFEQKKGLYVQLPCAALCIYIGELSAIRLWRRLKYLQKGEEERTRLLSEKRALTLRYEQEQRIREELRRFRHETANHLQNIRGLLARGNEAEAETYEKKLREAFFAIEEEASTGHPITDVIVSDRKRRARQAGISLSLRFAFREGWGISAYDLGILLSNILDNALEACERAEADKPDKRWISLRTEEKGNFLLLICENPFDESSLDGNAYGRDGYAAGTMCGKNRGSFFFQSEKAGEGHGLGLCNVRDIAKKYLGDLRISAKEGVFSITVMLQVRPST